MVWTGKGKVKQEKNAAKLASAEPEEDERFYLLARLGDGALKNPAPVYPPLKGDLRCCWPEEGDSAQAKEDKEGRNLLVSVCSNLHVPDSDTPLYDAVILETYALLVREARRTKRQAATLDCQASETRHSNVQY